MQRKNQNNLKKLAIWVVILIACPVIVSAVITQTDTIPPDTIDSTASQSKASNTAAQSQEKTSEQNLETAKKNIEYLINKFNGIQADYDGKTATYGFLIDNSIDANIAARALLDQAKGFIKIAEFKKDFEIVPNKIEYKKITPEDNKKGIRITRFNAAVEDKKLILDSEFQILDKTKDYSINYLIISSDNSDIIFSNPASETVYNKLESNPVRISKKTMTFDELKRRGFDTSKGIEQVDLYVYDKLNVKGDPTDKEKDVLIRESKSLAEEAQEISYGKNTKFGIEFFPSRKSLKLSVELDERDRDDFYYQFEFFTAKSNIPVLFPETRLSKAEMKKVEEVNNLIVPYDYFDIAKQSDVKSIKLNIYGYSTQEKPIYYKEEDLTAKPPSSYGVQCTKCNDDNICTLDECRGINKDNCIWIPDEGAWLKLKDLVGFGSYNTITNADKESGICKEKKSVKPEEECRARCESRSCSSEKENLCKADKKCTLDGDKCIPNPDFEKVSTLQKSQAQKWASLQKNYNSVVIRTINKINNKNIDAPLIYSILLKESGADSNAVSPSGAIGLMQITYGTACQYNSDCAKSRSVALIADVFEKIKSCGSCQKSPVKDSTCSKSNCKANIDNDDRFIPEKSIEASIYILNQKMKSFNGYIAQKELGIASYNVGEGVVEKAVNKIQNSKAMDWGQLKINGLNLKSDTQDGITYTDNILKTYMAIDENLKGIA